MNALEGYLVYLSLSPELQRKMLKDMTAMNEAKDKGWTADEQKAVDDLLALINSTEE